MYYRFTWTGCLDKMTITITSNYGLENFLLLCFCVVQILFWGYVYIKLKDFEYNNKRIIQSISKIGIRLVSVMWLFLSHLIIIATLLIASYDDYLPDKVLLFSVAYGITGVAFGLVAFLNILRYGYKVSHIEKFLRDLYEEINKR